MRAEGYGHIQNTFSQQANFNIDSQEVRTKSVRRQIPERLDDPDLVFSVTSDLDLIDTLDTVIRHIEKRVLAQAKHHDRNALAILKTIPGVGDILALTILYEIHTITRFKSASHFSSYCRLVKVERTSMGKKVGDRKDKIGNPHLKWAFCEIILAAQKYSEPIQKYYDKLKKKHGPAKAKILIAHKFAVAAYHMLKNGQAFDEKLFVA